MNYAALRRRTALVAALALAPAWPGPACAQESTPAPAPPAPSASAEPAGDSCGGPGRLLATLNRPTVGFSACAVPKGSIVLEEGYQSNYQAGASRSVTAAYPQGFERIGVAERLEVDLIGPTFNRMRSGSLVTSGYSDLGLGFKYELAQAGRFTYGIDALVTGPTGAGGFSNGGPSQTLNLNISYAASPAVGIGTTLAGSSTAGFSTGGAVDQNGNAVSVAGRYGTFNPSLVATVQIPHYYQFYAELVGQTKIAPGAGGRVFTDFGLQKLLGPYLEIDAEYGIDFTPVGGSRFDYLGFGAGVRV